MVDPESTSSTPRGRNAAQRHRRQVRRRVFGALSIALVLVLAALWFSDTIRIPTQGPSFAGGAEPNQRVGVAPIEGSVEPARRALNPLLPLNLWIGGDSLAGALGPSLGRMTAASGVVQPEYDSRISTGLMAGDLDWPEHATEQLARVNPEVVVFMIGTNDAIIYEDSLAQEYERLTDEMMQILIGPGSGREVYWVNVPVIGDEDTEEDVQKVNEIQREVAARYPQHVTLIDAHTLFADGFGEYQSSLPDENGKRVSMRAGDGIHLSGAGADHLAEEVFARLDALWRIKAQAVPGEAKRVIVTKGSTQIGGSSSGSSGSSSGGSNRWSGSSSGSGSGTQTSTTTSDTTPSTAPPPPPPPSSTATTTPTTSTTPTSTPPGG